MKEIFTRIYQHNGWGNSETTSGSGSSIFNTVAIRRELPFVIKELGVRSMIDVPCGDHHWMREVTLDIDEYIGADIVPELVERNSRTSGSERKRFCHLDVTRDALPRVDLIFCRDCFVHFSFADIRRSLQTMRQSRSIYLMTTTFTGIEENYDIDTGDWRPLNLQRRLFQFPAPLLIVREHGIWDGGEDSDKCMGVWNINDLLVS